jgi:hypothetical protein
LMTVDACGSFEEKRRVHQYGSHVRLQCRKKEKPRGSASSGLVRAGLLPGAELVGIIGLYSWGVNVGWSSRSILKRGSAVHACGARLEMGTAKIATRRPAFAQLKIPGGLIVCAKPTSLPSRANSTSGAPWCYPCNQQRRSRMCFSASDI